MKALTALTAALLATGGLPLAAVDAQTPRSLNLGREEREAIVALQAASAGVNRPAQDAALAAARARAQTTPARYAVAHYQFQIGRQRSDPAMQTQAAEAMIESGLATPEEMTGLVVLSRRPRARLRPRCVADRPADRPHRRTAAEQQRRPHRLRPVYRHPAAQRARPGGDHHPHQRGQPVPARARRRPRDRAGVAGKLASARLGRGL